MYPFLCALLITPFSINDTAGDPVSLSLLPGKRYYLIEANASPYVLSV
jgi:hypothetical protein